MKKWLSVLLLLAASAAGIRAQTPGLNAARIRRDASFLQAEGQAGTLHAADSAALAGLAAKIAARCGLSPAIGATYHEDLRHTSARIVEGRYTSLRYLRADNLDAVFAPRAERVRQLEVRAEQTGDPQFYTLAFVLAQSIPSFPADRLESLRQRSSGTWSLQDFVSREAEAVLAALEPRHPAVPAPGVGEKTGDLAAERQPRQTTEAPRTDRSGSLRRKAEEHVIVVDTVVVQRELGRIEVEHTFRRRDTVVIIHGTAVNNPVPDPKSPTAPKPRKERKALRLQGFALVQAGLWPDRTGGMMLGLGGAAWGGYLGGRSDFRTVASDYDCRSDGGTDYGQVWTSGGRKSGRFALTGGGWIRAAAPLRIYAGAGYGCRTVCWEDLRGEWARVTDYSAAGAVLEAGVLLSFGRFTVAAGGECIGFRQFGLQTGAGIRF